MDWKDVASAVGKHAPLVGTLLGGPAGAAIGGIVAAALGTSATPDAVSQALLTSPEAAIRLHELEQSKQIRLQELAVDQALAELAARVQNAGDVNRTIQAEAASEHWPTYSWRPFIGFVFGINLFIAAVTTAACYMAAMFGAQGATAAIASLPAMIGALGAVNGAAVPILGIASWFRGRMQADPNVPTINRG
jgi:hypothetical protein